MKYLLVICLLFSQYVYAEAYLCISEAGAGVSHDANKNVSSFVNDDKSLFKYILLKENDKWHVKAHGLDYILFDYCHTEYFCERDDGYAGTFLRNKDGMFSVVTLKSNDEKDYLFVERGKCSKI